MFYLDRYRIELLLDLAGLPESERGTHSSEADLFVRVALDAATPGARTAFLDIVDPLEGWPWSAIIPRELDLSQYEGLLGSISYAPPALVLFLGVALEDPDALEPTNWMSDEDFELLKPRLQRWSPDVIRTSVTPAGWKPVPAGEDTAPSEVDLPPPANGVDEPPVQKPPEDVAPQQEPAVPWYRRRAVMVGAGVGAASLVAVALWMRRRS